MAGVEGLDLDAHTRVGHHFRHRSQHAGRVGHDVVGLGEIHRAAVEGADFRQAGGDVLHAFARASHVGAGGGGQGLFGAAEHQVAAHAGRQVEADVDVGVADAVRDLAVEGDVTARRAGFRIADMAVHDCSTRPGCLDG